MPAYCIVYANPTYMVANKLMKEDREEAASLR